MNDEDEGGGEEVDDHAGIGSVPVAMHFGISCLFGGYVVYQQGKQSIFTSVDTLLEFLRKEIIALDGMSRENGY